MEGIERNKGTKRRVFYSTGQDFRVHCVLGFRVNVWREKGR